MKHANSVLEVEISRKGSKSWCVLAVLMQNTDKCFFELAFAQIYRLFPDMKRKWC
jgi:hypothetical protein